MNFARILGDRLLLSPLPPVERTSGGIIMPQGQAGDVMNYWRVEQVGEGKRNKAGELIPPDFKVGDIIITPLYHEHVTLEDGSKRKLVDVEQIVGKFEDVPDNVVEMPA